LAQDLLGWINLKPLSGLAANVGNAAVWDGLIHFLTLVIFKAHGLFGKSKTQLNLVLAEL